MSIVKSSAIAAAGEISASDRPMLKPEEFIEQVRALRERVPDLAPLSKETRTKPQFRRVARLNPEFTREAVSVVGASAVVQNVIGNTPDELVQAEDEMTRWSLAESELRSLLHGLAGANLVRRQRIGQAALEAYSVSRQLARREEHAHLVPHVEQMKRLPKFGRRRARGVQPPAPPGVAKPA